MQPNDTQRDIQGSIDRGAAASEALKQHFRNEKAPKTARACPFPGRVAAENLEEDFTTPGLTGNLECPFSKVNGATSSAARSRRDLPTPPDAHGDIHGEVGTNEPQPEIFSSPPPSNTASANKCPIRFLDQQSPEEVAAYFETHKHEIPRSHEICVKRYQMNSESIRQLDAKYGNLVSMIQGLGAKHQPYLPAKDDEEGVERGPSPAEHIEKWAEDVSTKPEIPVENAGSDHAEDEERGGHFERSLREIRVGESPSRPWGISVPVAHQASRSANLSSSDRDNIHLVPDMDALQGDGHAPTEVDESLEPDVADSSPLKSRSGPRSPALQSGVSAHTQPPAGHRAAKASVGIPEYQRVSPQPHMTFSHCTVFFGYSPEQASRLMQHGGLGGNK